MKKVEMTGKHTISVRCTAEIMDRLSNAAEKYGVSRTRLILWAMESVLQRAEREGMVSPAQKQKSATYSSERPVADEHH